MTSLFAKLEKPKDTLGYGSWDSVHPYVFLRVKEETPRPTFVDLFLTCPGADEMRLANRLDMEGAKWVPFKTELSWKVLPEEKKTTVFVLFKKKLPNGSAMITEMQSVSLDRESPWKMTTRLGESTWVDWSQGLLSVTASKINNENSLAQGETLTSETRYPQANLMTPAMTELRQKAFTSWKEVLLLPQVPIGNMIRLRPELMTDLLASFANLKVVSIDYPTYHSVRLTSEIPLYGSETVETLYPYLAQKQLSPPTEISLPEQYDSLVVDVRNYLFETCLFPELVAEDGDVLINASQMKRSKSPYVHFIRPQKNHDNIFPPQLEKLLGKALFIRASSLNAKVPSMIVLSKRNKDLVLAHPLNYEKFVNGGFWVLMD